MIDEPKKRSRAWGWIGWPLFALFVLYPLSIGPVLWWTDDKVSQWRTVAPAYAPIYWLAERFECVSGALYWYMTKWIDIQESG
jgi:hypothetical protein